MCNPLLYGDLETEKGQQYNRRLKSILAGDEMQQNETMPLWKAITAIVVIALIFIGGFYLLVRAVGIEGSLIWSTLIAAIGWIISEHISRRREHQKLLAEQKRKMYFEFLEFFLSITIAVREGKKDEGISTDQVNELSAWSLKLGLVGSDEVVKAWNAIRVCGETRDGTAMFAPIAALLAAMRRDCGHYGTTLTPVDLLALMVKSEDLEQVEAAMKSSG